MENNPASNPKNASSDEKSTKRHVYVEPGVKIDLVQDLKDEQHAQRREDAAHQKNQLFWTKVAAGLILIYTLFTGWQLKISLDTFSALYRPYVGVWNVDVKKNEAEKKMTINFSLKNFGSVPATNFMGDWRVTFDGQIAPVTYPAHQEPGLLMPTDYVVLVGAIQAWAYDAVTSGQKSLDVEVVSEYAGPGDKSYKYCSKHHYSYAINEFVPTSSTGCTLKPGKQ